MLKVCFFKSNLLFRKATTQLERWISKELVEMNFFTSESRWKNYINPDIFQDTHKDEK